MKQKITLTVRAAILLVLAATVAVSAWAADVVTVGTAGSGHCLPVGAFNKYVLSQQVYTADEINHDAGKIWSLGLNTVNGNVSRSLSVYVIHTDDSSVWSYTAPTENDLVFDGEMYFKSGQWNTMAFDKPFEYDGTSNLLITICDNTGTKGDYSSLTNRNYNPGSSQLIYATSDEQPYNPTDANEGLSFTSTSNWKAQIQLTFTDYPEPSGFAVNDITDVSALIQCTLRGEATAWNLRYRRIADEGEEELRWVQVNDLDTRSYTIEELEWGTRYEAQVQAIFDDEELSDWTAPITFATHSCPSEDMCEILYATNVYNANPAVVQITDAETGLEVGTIPMNLTGVNGGAIALCPGRTYHVNWINNNAYSYQTSYCSLTLFFTPGDEFYAMHFYEAPDEDALLTSFVMECGNYCAPRPRFVTSSNVTYEGLTLTYQPATLKEEIQFSTDPDFTDDLTTTIEVTRETKVEDEVSCQIKGMESLTRYYIRLRSICEGDEGISRWTDPLAILTTSKYSLPLNVIPSALNSTTEFLSWGRSGMEPKNNVNYRVRGEAAAAGNPMMIDLDGDGNSFENWSENTYASFGDKNVDNVLAIANVPANALVSWLAANGKSGDNRTVAFQYGFAKQSKKYNLEQESEAAAAELTDALKAQKEQEEINQADENYVENSLERARLLEFQIANLEAEYGALDPSSDKAEKLQDKIRLCQIELESIQNNLNMTPEKQASAEAAQAALAGANTDVEQGSQIRMTRAPEDPTDENYYFFYIRHHNSSDILLIKDITVTPPENIGDWTVIRNVIDVKHVLSGLQPGTEYDVMVQPVYNSGVVGAGGPISVFKTLGEETEPTAGEFSVAENKKVRFAHGNLRYDGDTYEGTWSMAKQQYEVLGEANIDDRGSRSYPASPTDLLCWSTVENHYGVSNFYYYDDEEAESYFKGEFSDWGTCPTLIRDLGTGWQTLGNDDWDYLLNKREDAEQLRSIATVNGVKGLVLLPDAWNAPDGVMVSEEMTVEQWAVLEQTGAVFLPAAGQLTTSDEGYVTTTTLTEACTYWTGSTAEGESELTALVLNISDEGVTVDTALQRRVATAVRLVKDAHYSPVPANGDINGDNIIDVTDLSAVIDIVLGKGSGDAARADLNGDGIVDVADVSILIDILLGK